MELIKSKNAIELSLTFLVTIILAVVIMAFGARFLYSLASEGAFVCFANPQNAPLVLEVLKRYNSLASIIGEVQSGKGVTVQTRFGKKNLPAPTGNLVPRIC